MLKVGRAPTYSPAHKKKKPIPKATGTALVKRPATLTKRSSPQNQLLVSERHPSPSSWVRRKLPCMAVDPRTEEHPSSVRISPWKVLRAWGQALHLHQTQRCVGQSHSLNTLGRQVPVTTLATQGVWLEDERPCTAHRLER